MPYSSFEYDRDFLKSGIELSPLRMPLGGAIYKFPSLAGEPFFGMPGLVADSLPGRFGNALIEEWLSSLGKSLSDFTTIDRLCYTGKREMGALEWSLFPAYDITFSCNPSNRWLRAHQMTINGKTTEITKIDLLAAGSQMGLKARRCKDIISEVLSAVEDFSIFAEQAGIREKTCTYIDSIISRQISI